FKTASAANREVTTLMDEIEERAERIQTTCPDAAVDVRRATDPCVVEVGDVGLRLSWLRPPTLSTSMGSLIVMEWEGTVTFPGERVSALRHAKVLGELMLHLETGAGAAWYWSMDDVPMRTYLSADFASRCIQQVVRRIEEAVVTATECRSQLAPPVYRTLSARADRRPRRRAVSGQRAPFTRASGPERHRTRP
ncbi:MAG: hypothetical protein ACREOJ_10160, partial [Gemmatimonadaceae bacterium]